MNRKEQKEELMLAFLPAFVRIPLVVLIVVANTLVHCVPLFTFALLKLLLPVPPLRRLLSRLLILIAESWIGVNDFTLQLFSRIDWDVHGKEGLMHGANYLVVSNHQSWVDIPVLQRTFNKEIPFLRFFLKQELIRVPILGLAWWALDFPFMKRYSKEFLEAHPELEGKDLETTRRACEKFRDAPVSVMNFVEGTRFTERKHDQQHSPFAHLLRPKAGGVAFVINAMSDILSAIVDVTIVYPGGRPTFMDLLAGRVRQVRVFIRELPIPPELRGGDYTADPAYRERFQHWISELWDDKDALIGQMGAYGAKAVPGESTA
jgi:1-acyl-sn-glycerol-3-phosphate acyltransferase